MNVFISPNIKKEKAFINVNGDVIDQRTKQVLESNTPDYIPTMEEIKANIAQQDKPQVAPQSDNPLDIQKQIEQAEAHLVELKAKKAEQIALMKKQLEALEG